MKVLAIDTCTEACSAALLLDGQILEHFELAPRRHTELVLVMVDAIMAEAGIGLSALDGLAFGRGPGAFSGVRIGCSIIQALAFAADLPVAPVSTLAALAYGAYLRRGDRSIIAAIDARMQEVYWAGYSIDTQGVLHACTDEHLGSAGTIAVPQRAHWLVTGSGGDTYREVLTAHLAEVELTFDPHQFPRAGTSVRLGQAILARGEGVSGVDAQPVYLRNEVATAK